MMPRIYFKRDKSRKAPNNIGDTLSDGMWYIPGVGIIEIKDGKCVMGITDLDKYKHYEAESDQERMANWHRGFSGPVPVILTINRRKIKINLK